MKVLMAFLFYYLPFLRVPGDVYGWHMSVFEGLTCPSRVYFYPSARIMDGISCPLD